MKAEAFEEKFESGECLIDDVDLAKARRPRQASRSVNVAFPAWLVEQIDKEARRLGVTRQSIITIWLSERLEQTASTRALQRSALGSLPPAASSTS